MVKKFGVALDDDVARQVEQPLEYGASRSDRIEQLLIVALTVEDMVAEENLDIRLDADRRVVEGAVRQLVIDAARRRENRD